VLLAETAGVRFSILHDQTDHTDRLHLSNGCRFFRKLNNFLKSAEGGIVLVDCAVSADRKGGSRCQWIDGGEPVMDHLCAIFKDCVSTGG